MDSKAAEGCKIQHIFAYFDYLSLLLIFLLELQNSVFSAAATVEAEDTAVQG